MTNIGLIYMHGNTD